MAEGEKPGGIPSRQEAEAPKPAGSLQEQKAEVDQAAKGIAGAFKGMKPEEFKKEMSGLQKFMDFLKKSLAPSKPPGSSGTGNP